MHTQTDILGGTVIGVVVWAVQWTFHDSIDTLMTQSSWTGMVSFPAMPKRLCQMTWSLDTECDGGIKMFTLLSLSSLYPHKILVVLTVVLGGIVLIQSIPETMDSCPCVDDG